MEDGVVELARPDDAAELIDLRDRLADWLTQRGVDQWIPGEFPRERMADWIEQQAIHVVRRDGRPVAAVAVLWEDSDIWGTDDAGRLHPPAHGRPDDRTYLRCSAPCSIARSYRAPDTGDDRRIQTVSS